MDERLVALFEGREYDERTLRVSAAEINDALITDSMCPTCAGMHQCRMPKVGWQCYFDGPDSDKFGYPVWRYRRCHFERAQQSQEQMQITVRRRFQTRSFETWDDKTQKQYITAKTYADNLTLMTTHGLCIVGPVGTGKTHLAVSVLKTALAKGIPATFVSVPRLLEEVRRSYDDREADQRLAEKVRETRLVVLDDLGAEKPTGWTWEQMYLLINERYEQMLPTIVTTNCGPAELAKRVGERVADRLKEMCEVVICGGPSKRGQ